MFQSTHPCGCELYVQYFFFFDVFQSTHPCGCESEGLETLGKGTVSIHAPVWVRNGEKHKLNVANRFQSTHPCGCEN